MFRQLEVRIPSFAYQYFKRIAEEKGITVEKALKYALLEYLDKANSNDWKEIKVKIYLKETERLKIARFVEKTGFKRSFITSIVSTLIAKEG